MNRHIRKVAVLGSGVMGSRIACHFANIGCDVLLLDIAPKELLPQEEKSGLTLDSKLVKNRIVNLSLETAVKSNPLLFTENLSRQESKLEILMIT